MSHSEQEWQEIEAKVKRLEEENFELRRKLDLYEAAGPAPDEDTYDAMKARLMDTITKITIASGKVEEKLAAAEKKLAAQPITEETLRRVLREEKARQEVVAAEEQELTTSRRSLKRKSAGDDEEENEDRDDGRTRTVTEVIDVDAVVEKEGPAIQSMSMRDQVKWMIRQRPPQ